MESKMKTYSVVRQHLGDKMYMPGDKREAAPSDVAHLIAAGVLAEIPETKAEKSLQNKATKPVSNKAD
jgi:hypothetical protein